MSPYAGGGYVVLRLVGTKFENKESVKTAENEQKNKSPWKIVTVLIATTKDKQCHESKLYINTKITQD